MGTLLHYLGENRQHSIDFGLLEELEAGDTIHQVSPVAISPDDGTLSVGVPTISGAKVSFWISGGTAGITYTLSCFITTSSGAIIAGSGELLVSAVP